MKFSVASMLVAGAILAGCLPSPAKQSAATPPVEALTSAERPTASVQTPQLAESAAIAPPPAEDPPAVDPPVIAAPDLPAPEVEVFPGVWLNAAKSTVWFDAIVCINAHDDQKPIVYLEQIACIPDTVEHESLVMTQARPSHVHAALLMAGLEPGKPGEFDWIGEAVKPISPLGPALSVVFVVDGRDQDPTQWVVSRKRMKTLRELSPTADFRFAGSTFVKRSEGDVYHADRSGTLIGLTTFGTETIAWSDLYNPDAGVEDPDWIANANHVPVYATPVKVRLSPATAP